MVDESDNDHRRDDHEQEPRKFGISLTEAVSKGAKHLEDAVKLVERLAGALSGARSAKIEPDTQLRLPPPENKTASTGKAWPLRS